jgi:GxxExxY protein
MKGIIYPELSYLISGFCFKVHNSLGRFCKEKQYGDELEKVFKQNGIPYEREVKLEVINRASPSGNRADFLLFDRMILELKAKQTSSKDDYFQVQRYLNGSGLKLGLLVNFRRYHLNIKRILRAGAKHGE